MWTCQKCNESDENDDTEICFKCMTPRVIEVNHFETRNALSIDDTDPQTFKSDVDTQKDIDTYASNAKVIYLFLSWFFLILSIGLSIYGINKLYDDSFSSRVVGGDAFNFIIYATRGTAWVCVGIVSVLIGLIFAVFANIENQNKLQNQ